MQLRRKQMSNRDLRTQSIGGDVALDRWVCTGTEGLLPTGHGCSVETQEGVRQRPGGYVNRCTMTALSRLASFRVWFSSASSLFGKVVMRTKLVAAMAGRASTMKSRMSLILEGWRWVEMVSRTLASKPLSTQQPSCHFEVSGQSLPCFLRMNPNIPSALLWPPKLDLLASSSSPPPFFFGTKD